MKSQGRIGGEMQLNKPQSSHIFSLSSMDPKSKSRFDIEVDFSSCSMETQSLGDNNVDTTSNLSSLPVFNFDRNIMTPAFILKDEKAFFQSNNDICHEDRLPHFEKNIEEPEYFMIAKPKSQYCSVCKSHFSDYLNHIKRQDHIQKLRNANKKNKIDGLITYFEKSKKNKEKRKSSFQQMEVIERKKKVRIIDELSFSSVSKNVSESITNNSSMQKETSQKFHSERILQY